jgi:formylglycine-generating enzyme required for sulfatase activity
MSTLRVRATINDTNEGAGGKYEPSRVIATAYRRLGRLFSPAIQSIAPWPALGENSSSLLPMVTTPMDWSAKLVLLGGIHIRGLALMGILCGGCPNPSEIVISIDTDLLIPKELDAFKLTIDQLEFNKTQFDNTYSLASRRDLPGTIDILAGKNPRQPILITLLGQKDQKDIVERKSRLPFVEEKTLLLPMDLLRSCAVRKMPCPSGQTCREDGCVDIDIDPLTLSPFSKDRALEGRFKDAAVSPDPHDARASDAVIPEKSRDAGPAKSIIGTWVQIPKGTFQMGSPPSEPCRGSDEELHQVTLTHGFELMATEVTQERFEGLMGYNPSSFKNCGSDCPVENVNWHEAVAYCNALSQQKGLALCYSCTGSNKGISCQDAPAFSGKAIYDCPGYRLPTEAEWEYAYRAESASAYYNGPNDGDACQSCKSDTNLLQIGWYCNNSTVSYAGCYDSSSYGGPICAGPQPVGKKTPNGWGLHDMAGNVWEWTHDWYESNKGSSSVVDPFGPTNGSCRVFRGGAWCTYAHDLRAAIRNCYKPTTHYHFNGLRCARRILP